MARVGAGGPLVSAGVRDIFLATLDKKVVLFDADLGGANLHTFVGVERPNVTLAELRDSIAAPHAPSAR